MRTIRCIAVAALVAASIALVVDPDTLAQEPPKTKAQKRAELKKAKAKDQRRKAAEAKARQAAEEAAALEKAQREAEQRAKERANRPRPKPRPVEEIARIIDSHIERKLAADKLSASPICTDAEFLRRASLDITGVIPTAEEARQFLDDSSHDKRAGSMAARGARHHAERHPSNGTDRQCMRRRPGGHDSPFSQGAERQMHRDPRVRNVQYPKYWPPARPQRRPERHPCRVQDSRSSSHDGRNRRKL